MPFPFTFPYRFIGAPPKPVATPTPRHDPFSADNEEQPDFGFDIAVVPGLDPTWTPRRDHLMLADAVVRRLLTPRGRLWAYPDYGIDLRDYLNDEITPETLAALKADVEGQAEQDERVLGAAATVSYDYRTETISVRLALDSDVGSFALVLGVSDVSTTLLLAD